MRAIGAGLLWLSSMTGAAAFDIENHARWAVLDDLPVLANGQAIRPEVSSLRTVDITGRPLLRSAVCGTLDFQNTDEGRANFVAFYSMNDMGKIILAGRPYLYDPLSAQSFDPLHEAAVEFCGPPTEITVISGNEVAARTEAAAVAVRP
jgi:hypothetical protein